MVLSSRRGELKFDMTIGNSHPLQGPFSPVEIEAWGDAKFPPGAFIDGDTTTFAVYSKNATRVLLEIFNAPMAEPACFDYWLDRGSDNIWRGRLAAAPAGTLYAFRCWG